MRYRSRARSSAASPLLVACLTQKRGARTPEGWNSGAERGKFVQTQWLLHLASSLHIGNGMAAPGDHHVLAGLHLVQQLAEMRFRLCQIDRDHDILVMVMKLVTM